MRTLTQSVRTSNSNASFALSSPLFFARYSTLLGKYTAFCLMLRMYLSSASRFHLSSRTMGNVIRRPGNVSDSTLDGRDASASTKAASRSPCEMTRGS